MANSHLQPVHTGFNPTRQDIQVVLRILTGLRLAHRTIITTTPPNRLPPELALSILAHAGYHPRITAARAEEAEYHANDFWQPGPQASVAGLYLTTHAPLPTCLRRVREVTVQMRGADQGWATFGGEGTYENSHTWFEVCILRPVGGVDEAGQQGKEGGEQHQQPLEAREDVLRTFRSPGDAREELEQFGWRVVGPGGGRDGWLVHHNSMSAPGYFRHRMASFFARIANEADPTVTASEAWKDYRVDWVAGKPTEVEVPGAVGDGEGFLSALMPGDKIALWARAEVSNPS